jgi:uncharacterized repeat protein (TIGR01451 family)
MKLKKLLFPFLLIIISFSAYSQVWNWANKLSAQDLSGIHGIATVIDVQGNHVVLSGVDTAWQIEGNFSLNNQFFVTKYDNQGNLLWIKNFSHNTSLWSYSLATDSAGSIYLLTGKFTKVDGVAYAGPNASNYFTKLNSSGDLIWTKPLGQLNQYHSKTLKSDGRYVYLYGDPSYSNSFQFLDTTFTAPTPPGGVHPEFTFLAKLDTAGNRKWQKLFIDTLGYSWAIAMNINNKKEIAISGSFRKKIWINNSPFTNQSAIWDYQYYAIFNTDSGQVLRSALIDLSRNYLFNAIEITDSSVFVYPQHSQDTLTIAWMLPSGVFTLTYQPGNYLIGIKNGSLQFRKKISSSPLSSVSSLEADAENNVYASIKHYFQTGQTIDSACLAVAKFKASYDTSRNSLWQANVGGNYTQTSLNSFIAPSISVKDGVISFTGGFRNTGLFGPYAVTANNFRKSFIASLQDNYCVINGKVFIDTNNNGVFDTNEQPVRNLMVSTQNNYIDYTDANGDYKLLVDIGNSTAQISALSYYTSVPASHNVSFSSYGQTSSGKNFALQAAVSANDVEIDVTPITPARQGRPLYYQLTLKNKGTTTLTNKYSLKMGANLSFVSSDSTATVIGDSIIWNYNNLGPLQTRTNLVTCNVLLATPGTIIKSIGYVYPIINDSTPVNNIDTVYSTAIASYDPNDKIVFPGNQVHIDSVQQGKQFLEYIIRFQNTGTDTAFQVKVIDSVSAKLNIQTFELISSSHPVLINRKGQRTFEFYFPNILLPDSNVNELRSHGFVKFRIKPVTTVALNDSVYNYADIYFDYNTPVKTNTISVGFRNTIITGINSPTANTIDLKIYPNPSSELFIYKLIKSPRESLVMRIYDMQGRIIFNRNISGTGDTLSGEIHASSIPKGQYVMEIRSKTKIFVKEFVLQ